MAKSSSKDHPLANLLVNVLVPVLILSYLSKDPAIQAKLHQVVRPWHLGPLKAMVLALSLPLAYGIWHFIRTRKMNFFSALGLASVALSGGLTLFLWNANGTVKPQAGLLFGLKEALIPMVLGIAVLTSQRSASPLIRVFLYNDSIFDISKIESRVRDLAAESDYERLLAAATRLFALSFFVSSVMNLIVAQWFFLGFDASAANALEQYNGILAKITGWGLAIIGVPIIVFLFFTLRRLVKGLGTLTGFRDEELLLPR